MSYVKSRLEEDIGTVKSNLSNALVNSKVNSFQTESMTYRTTSNKDSSLRQVVSYSWNFNKLIRP